MAKAGASFGSHGYTHRKLSLLSNEQINEEVALSISSFEKHLGYHPVSFAIPWGDEASYTSEALRILRAHRIEMVFTTRPERTPLPTEGFVFPRITIREHDNLASFSRKLQGAHEWLRWLLSPFLNRTPAEI